MDDTCSYQRDGQRCILRAHHPVRYHRLGNGGRVAISDADASGALALNPELAATGACVTALEDLPADAQLRVLAFLSGRFSNYIAPPERTRQLAERTVRRIV